MPNVLTIDSQTFPHIHFTSIKRNFEVLDGENAGRLMSGEMERDIIGTYYNYTAEIEADDNYPAEYDSFYEIISAPDPSHTITVPYGQTTLTFTAYVTQGSDELLYMVNGNRWGNLSFNFIAMSPQRRAT